MTIWRDVQGEAQQIKRRTQWEPVQVMCLDGAYVLGWETKRPVLVAVDFGTGEPIAVGYINEYDPQAICRWLEPLVQRHGITVIVTDDLSSYKIVPRNYNSHIRSASSMSVAGWANARTTPEDDPRRMVVDPRRNSPTHRHLAPTGSRSLYALWKQVLDRRSLPSQSRFPMEQLRYVLLRSSQD